MAVGRRGVWLTYCCRKEEGMADILLSVYVALEIVFVQCSVQRNIDHYLFLCI